MRTAVLRLSSDSRLSKGWLTVAEDSKVSLGISYCSIMMDPGLNSWLTDQPDAVVWRILGSTR